MLPLILNFPDMKAMVGFSLPKKKTQNHQEKERNWRLRYHIVVTLLPSSTVKASEKRFNRLTGCFLKLHSEKFNSY